MQHPEKAQQLYKIGHDFINEAESRGGDFLFVPQFAYAVARKCVIQTPNERILITNPKIEELDLDIIELFSRPHPIRIFTYANKIYSPTLAVRIARLGTSEPNYLGSTTSCEVMDLTSGSKLATEQKLMQVNRDALNKNILNNAPAAAVLKSLQTAYTQSPSPDYLDDLFANTANALLARVTMYDLAIDDQPRRPYPILP